MAQTDDERESRLRPPKPRVTRNEGAAWSHGFKLLMHYASQQPNDSATARRAEREKRCGPTTSVAAVRGTALKQQDPGMQWMARRALPRTQASTRHIRKRRHARGIRSVY